MSIKYLLGASICALAASSLAMSVQAADEPHQAAIKACTTANASQPASFVTVVDDGRGGSLVWLSDANSGLWLCSADSEGKIYAYSMMAGDILQGAGASLVDIKAPSAGEVTEPELDPIDVAVKACQITFDGAPVKVIGQGADGLDGNWVPGYFAFIETDSGATYLCDATADAQVWAFAEIGAPLELEPSVS